METTTNTTTEENQDIPAFLRLNSNLSEDELDGLAIKGLFKLSPQQIRQGKKRGYIDVHVSTVPLSMPTARSSAQRYRDEIKGKRRRETTTAVYHRVWFPGERYSKDAGANANVAVSGKVTVPVSLLPGESPISGMMQTIENRPPSLREYLRKP